MNASVALHVDGLSRSLGGKRIVDGVTLTLSRGELLTLVGPSGCGKSTLLRMIAGLEPSDGGRVIIDDHDMSSTPPEQRHIGFVFQDGSLFGHLRVDQNVAFGLKHLSRSERTARVEAMLELVQLSGVARRYPHQLSGGEQQRVALARALATEPRLMLLDEPFASLDEVLREELRRQVAEVLRATRTPSILVTHDRHEALTLGDRVAVMRDGRIQQVDSPEAVHDRPSNRFVAGFMGVASFLPDSEGMLIVVRPHQVAMTPGGDDVVLSCEFAGATRRYTVRRHDGTVVVADGASSVKLATGDACTLQFTTERLHRVVAES
ncbi:MAG: hypothetical protein B7C54_11505 [Acidimicrobiales bacterium mtb01]|nr:ABC transporter ATP-binding protein [Actinomycetota bacterium]TEX45673.1 MAG: hypothetical protein B7C54_11505 [Acidimicrobiales bacterium mtb01]